MERLTFVSTLASLCLAAVLCAPASAQQSYPSKPIRLVLPFPPGAPSDMTNHLANELLRSLEKVKGSSDA